MRHPEGMPLQVKEASWIRDALDRNELRITEHRNCPFCNPQRRLNTPTKLNACKRHKWVYKQWFDGMVRWLTT